eukprot:2614791-Prymnesium_polylepis.2
MKKYPPHTLAPRRAGLGAVISGRGCVHHGRNRSRAYGARFTDGCVPCTSSAMSWPVMPPSVHPTCWWPKAK